MSDRPEHHLPISDGLQSVPVFDCHVIVTPPASPGEDYGARVANRPEIAARAGTERECLRRVVEEFKLFLKKSLGESKEIKWEASQSAQAGESERWIPVHL